MGLADHGCDQKTVESGWGENVLGLCHGGPLDGCEYIRGFSTSKPWRKNYIQHTDHKDMYGVYLTKEVVNDGVQDILMYHWEDRTEEAFYRGE